MNENGKYLDYLAGLPLRMWIGENELFAEGDLFTQADNVSRLEPAFHHVALMSDAHPGFGMPIGGVAALDAAISPFMVGSDEGCGMLALRLDADADEMRHLIEKKDLLPHIADYVPVGPGGHRDRADRFLETAPASVLVSDAVKNHVPFHKGTLGGGNHYISLDYDTEGNFWASVHSGSRRLGKELADHYHRIALAQCRASGIVLPHDELAYITEGTPEFDAFVEALDFALAWAMDNRRVMGENIVKAIAEATGKHVSVEDAINVHHNFASKESFFGREVWVHRKGATRALAGERSIIPGHVTAGTYVCEGLGNEDSFNSSSHGAGRRLGRNQAKRTLDLAHEEGLLAAARVTLWSPGGHRSSLDEMPSAYKSPSRIMAQQEDLVRVTDHLRPIGVIKG